MKYLLRNLLFWFFACGVVAACAAPTTTADGGTDWYSMAAKALIAVIVITVVGYLGYRVWKKEHPAAAPVPVPANTAAIGAMHVDSGVHTIAAPSLSPDAAAIVGKLGSLLDHLDQTAAANAAKIAPPGGEGTAGMFVCKVSGTPSADIPAMTAAYFRKPTATRAK